MIRSAIYTVAASSLLSSSCAFAPLTFGGRSAVSLNSETSEASETSEESKTKSLAETVLENPDWPPEWPYSEEDFARMDEEDDAMFYSTPRMLYHIDNAAVGALTEYYREHLVDGQDVLDLCSSWVSHFPDEWNEGNVWGLGMNEYELCQNVQLSGYVVKDLNVEPVLPFPDRSFDVVTCVAGVDYLNKPREVFKEIGRILRPGGTCMLAISNKCFPTKVFRIWLETTDVEHVLYAGSFFHYSGKFDPPECDDISPNPGNSDPLYIIRASKKL